MAGRVLAIASFHSEALFTSFARQTDEPENSSDRETLRFRVRRPKRRKRDVCAFFFLSSSIRIRTWRLRWVLRARCADSSHSLDFCLFPSPRFYPRSSVSAPFFGLYGGRATKMLFICIVCDSTGSHTEKERERGKREGKREKINEWKDDIINLEKSQSMNVRDSLKVWYQRVLIKNLCKLFFNLGDFQDFFYKCEESQLYYPSEIIKRDLMQILQP